MIVLIAKQDDEHGVTVKRILEDRHQEQVSILDTSRFPVSVSLACHFNGHGSSRWLTDDAGNGHGQGERLDLGSVKSFWWRRPQGVGLDERLTDPHTRNFAYSECLSALHGALACGTALWVNDIFRDDAADYKPRQLEAAAAVGLTVPETLITNDPRQAIDFWHQHAGAVVYKAFNQRGIVWRPARRLTPEDLALMPHVRAAPVIFQALVPGTRDIRATVIGRTCFAAEFVIPEGEAIDYRVHLGTAPCHPHTLPPDLVTRMLALMARLRLEYGAMDFRITPQGEYVFFEVNTGGEFMYVQHRTGQPIADAVAAHLAGGESVHG